MKSGLDGQKGGDEDKYQSFENAEAEIVRKNPETSSQSPKDQNGNDSPQKGEEDYVHAS